MSISTVTNIENNEMRIYKNHISGHIRLALFSFLPSQMSHDTAFFFVRETDANVLTV